MKFVDLARETSTTTGTGSIVLDGAVANHRVFAPVAGIGYAVGDEVPYGIRMGAEYEFGKGTKTANGIARTTVTASSNGNQLVNLSAGTKEVYCNVGADFLNGSTIAELSDGGAAQDNDIIEISRGGLSLRVLVAAIRAAASTDTAGPTMNGSLTSSNVTQTAATLAWPAASDNVAVTGYEASKDGGTTWTNIGNVLTYTYSALSAGTTYPMRVRATDAAGNKSTTPLALPVTTAATTDTTDPTMSGSLSFTNTTSSGYTMNWPAGADNVAVTGYEISTDGGTTWIDVGNVLTKAVTGASASTTYTPRVRAYDAAGRRSNVLSAPVTTAAAAGTTYTIIGYGGVQGPPASVNAASSQVYGTKKLAIEKPGAYYTFSPAPASAVSGWGTSNTVPPATLSDPNTNYNGANSVNGMVSMGAYDGTSFRDMSSYWPTVGAGTVTVYLWIKPVDGAAYCFNPSGTVVSNI